MKTSNKLLLGLLVVVILVITVFIVLLRTNANAKFLEEYSSNSSTFLLIIENTTNGIKITSTKGCAFKELAFPLQEGQTQEIDQFGMRNPNDKVDEDDALASFRIAIQKTKSGLALEGIEGTSFKKLSFSCRVGRRQLINQNGMLPL